MAANSRGPGLAWPRQGAEEVAVGVSVEELLDLLAILRQLRLRQPEHPAQAQGQLAFGLDPGERAPELSGTGEARQGFGGLFAGESMFHRVDNASKVALYHLVQHLRARGFVLFDIQVLTPVTELLGAVTIPRQAYLRRLAQAVKLPVTF